MQHKRRLIYLAAFLFYIPIALVSYINSSFLEEYVGKNFVGLIYIVASIVTILSLPKMRTILTHFGNRLTALAFCTLTLLSLIVFSSGTGVIPVILSFIIYFTSLSFIFASLDIFIEDSSKDSSTGKIRGIYLLSINSAWIIGQFISSIIIDKIGFSGVYLLSAGFIMLGMLVIGFSMRDFRDPEYKKLSPFKTIKTFVKNKNLFSVYVSNFVLQFFYAIMVIYLPIHLHEYLGFEWSKISAIFVIMLIPFVLLDYPLGKLSDKIGEKEMLAVGFFVAFISTLAIPFITSSAFVIWAVILFATRIGAATIEVMNDSYFFKNIKKEDADEVSFFRNANPLAYVIAPLFATIILFFIPEVKYLFFFLSLVLLAGFIVSIRMKDVR